MLLQSPDFLWESIFLPLINNNVLISNSERAIFIFVNPGAGVAHRVALAALV